jgi:hypothetical protein
VFREHGATVWPIEEAMFLLLSKSFERVYEEIADLLVLAIREQTLDVDTALLADLLVYQEARTPRPGGPRHAQLRLAHDWPSYFDALARGEEAHPERTPTTLRIVDQHKTNGDLVRFAREVVWYGRSATNLVYRIESVTMGDSPIPPATDAELVLAS